MTTRTYHGILDYLNGKTIYFNNRCKESFYNYPACEECNCNPAGVASGFLGCGTTTVPKGELCKCKERVTGRICNECKPLYWNLNISEPEGCRGETANSFIHIYILFW